MPVGRRIKFEKKSKDRSRERFAKAENITNGVPCYMVGKFFAGRSSLFIISTTFGVISTKVVNWAYIQSIKACA